LIKKELGLKSPVSGIYQLPEEQKLRK